MIRIVRCIYEVGANESFGCQSSSPLRRHGERASLQAPGEDASNQSTPQEATTHANRLLKHPIWVYNNWSAYDELSDRIPLTEELAMRELSQIKRLRRFGVHFDYYVMDAFWFSPMGPTASGASPNGRTAPTAGLPNVVATEFFPGCGSAPICW